MIVEYPESESELVFAFNPIPVEVTKVSGTVTLKTTLKTDVTIEIDREPIDKKVTFDLQAIARSLFDRKNFHLFNRDELGNLTEKDNKLYKPLSFSIGSGGSPIESKTIDIIWGALQIGEIYSQSKTLTWFKNFPFTVPLYLSQDREVLMRYDKNKYETLPFGENQKLFTKGKYNIKGSRLPNATDKVVLRINADDEGGVFDYTFDHTFRKISKDTILIRLNVNECTDGIYLRWINKHGEYCYYLFSTGIESNEVRNGGINLIEFIRTVGFIYGNSLGYNPGTDHTQSKEGQKLVRLFVPLVDADTYKFLTSLVESVVVDMFMGYDNDDKEKPLWIGVNIAQGTFARDNSPLQDFECNLILPKTFTQEL